MEEEEKNIQDIARESHPKMIIVGAGKAGAMNAERELRALRHEQLVVVEGVKFEPRKQSVLSPQAKRLKDLAMEASMYDPYAMRKKTPRIRPDVDIIEEYKLVINKKSKLGRNDRDWVKYTFHSLYKIKSDV